MYGDPIPDNEKRAINIFNLLEQTRLDSDEQFWTKDELDQFSGDLWQTTDQFERHLKKLRTGDDIIKDKLINKFQRREAEIKDKAAMRIEALESAIIELKNNKNREIEQLTMSICDQESSQNNMEASVDEIEGFIAQISKGHISSIGEAMERIFSAIRFIKKLKTSLDN